MRLDGLNCVITGGSSGIGAATAKRFVAEGAQVLILDINMDAADTLADELGPAAATFYCDVKSEVAVKAAAEAAYGRWNRVDVLVNNAGMMDRWTNQMPDKQDAQEMLKGTMPIGRMGSADEVAGAILFFASADSSLCQGSVLAVDGGFTAQ